MKRNVRLTDAQIDALLQAVAALEAERSDRPTTPELTKMLRDARQARVILTTAVTS